MVTNYGREIIWVFSFFRPVAIAAYLFNSPSVEFSLRGSLMKIFNTRSKYVVHFCMEIFNVQTPYDDIMKRRCKFLYNVMSSENLLSEICQEFAENELRGYVSDCVQ